MRFAFCPVQAAARKASPSASKRIHVHAEFAEPTFAVAAQFVVTFATETNYFGFFQRTGYLHRDASRQMVVARPGILQRIKFSESNSCIRGWNCRDGAQSLHRMSYFAARDLVIAMTALALHGQQAAVYEF